MIAYSLLLAVKMRNLFLFNNFSSNSNSILHESTPVILNIFQFPIYLAEFFDYFRKIYAQNLNYIFQNTQIFSIFLQSFFVAQYFIESKYNQNNGIEEINFEITRVGNII